MEEATNAPEPLYLAAGNPYAHSRNKVHGHARLFYGQQRFGGPFGWFGPGLFTTNEMDAQHIVEALDKLMKSERPALGRGN